MSLDLTILVALGFVGLLAGFVDAIAGGGGLIALPVLLSVGIPPVTAFGTNKLQSVVGTAIAAFTYWRKGFVSLQLLAIAIPLTFVGSFLGALAVKSIDTTVLQYAVPVALIAVALYFAFAPKLTDEDSQARLSTVIFVPVMGFAIGFYDGILGPGTGSFLTLGFVTLFGFGVTRAAGHTKVLNLTSNIGALALFIPSGNVVLPVAVAMIIGQIVGGYLGALTGIRFGAKLIRPLVVVVSIALAAKLLMFP